MCCISIKSILKIIIYSNPKSIKKSLKTTFSFGFKFQAWFIYMQISSWYIWVAIFWSTTSGKTWKNLKSKSWRNLKHPHSLKYSELILFNFFRNIHYQNISFHDALSSFIKVKWKTNFKYFNKKHHVYFCTHLNDVLCSFYNIDW